MWISLKQSKGTKAGNKKQTSLLVQRFRLNEYLIQSHAQKQIIISVLCCKIDYQIFQPCLQDSAVVTQADVSTGPYKNKVL